MIYLDTSVVLAQLLSEDRKPPRSLWEGGSLVSSRLLEYEVWTRIHGRRAVRSHGEPAGELMNHISFLELSPLVLERVLGPFPLPVRTVDAMHLASIEFLRERRLKVTLATYDRKLSVVARRMGIGIESL